MRGINPGIASQDPKVRRDIPGLQRGVYSLPTMVGMYCPLPMVGECLLPMVGECLLPMGGRVSVHMVGRWVSPWWVGGYPRIYTLRYW